MGQTSTLGIDLGTTNSAVSIVETGEPILIKNHNQRLLTPSVVRFPLPDSDRKHPLVGITARNTRKQYPTYTVSSVKREMGTDTTYQFDGNQYTPPEVASYILHALKFAASDALEIPVDQLTDVVITVPAYFSETQRQATRTAAEMAEFERIELLNEPTAAAIADGYQAGGRVEDVLVYDLGGGTFDVSVIKVGQNTFRVRATGGDESLGGDDWDQALTEWAATQIEQAHGVNPFNPQPDEDPAITASRRARLREEVRQAKESLCAEGRPAEITLPYFMHDHTDSPISVKLTLDMDTLTRVTDHLLEQTIDPVRDAIAESDSSIQELDDVVLVGGATRMPQVRRRLETLLGRRIQPPSDPDYAVAKGAAIKGKQGSVILQEVTPLALGVGVAHGKFEPVIPRNTPLPADGSTMLTTSKPNQTAARIEIYQGQADIVEENRYLDTFFISGIAPAAPGIPQIRVEFNVDLQGLITVTAESVDSLSGEIKNTLRIEGSNDISQATIDAHIERVQSQREKESQRIALIEQLSTLEEHISRARQLQETYAEGLSQDDVEALQTAIETGQQYLNEDTTTLEELTQYNEQLDHLLTEIGTVALVRHSSSAPDQGKTSSSANEQQSSESDSQTTFDITEPSEGSQEQARTEAEDAQKPSKDQSRSTSQADEEDSKEPTQKPVLNRPSYRDQSNQKSSQGVSAADAKSARKSTESTTEEQIQSQTGKTSSTHAATPTPSEEGRGDDTATADRRSRQPQETPQVEDVRGHNSEGTVAERPTETNFAPDDGTRPSVTASQTPVPAHRGICTDYPVQQVLRSVELPPSTYEQYDISKSALDFMSTVLAVMNNTTPLPRYASLTPVREFFIRERDLKKPEIQHLCDEGWLVEHDFARGLSYTVTPAGREFLGPEQHVAAGRGIGDRGDGMPHRVGADLAIEWLARNPEITEIRSFMSIEEDIDGVCDVAGYTRVADDTKKIHTIVEVEGGRTQAERDDTNASSSPFGHDYDSLVTDYENLAAVIESESSTDDAQAVWVVRNKKHAKHVLTALENRDKLTDVDSLRSACNANFSRLNKKLAQRQFPGLDRILSYRGLQRELKSH